MATTKFNKKASLEKFNQIPAGPEWIGIRRAAEVLGVHPSTLRRWINVGEIPAERRDINGIPERNRNALNAAFGNPYAAFRLYTVISKYDLERLAKGEAINIFISDFGKAA